MADHSRNALQAAARAMEEVVLPAIDPKHPLAAEQARLVANFLSLFEQRIDYAHDRNRFELVHYLELGRTLEGDAEALSAAIAGALRAGLDDGEALRDQPGAPLAQVQAAAQQIAGVISALVRTAATASADRRGRIEGRVLCAAQRLLDMQRAWFLPQGWEPDRSRVPSIDSVFGPLREKTLR